jgi:hypothetical protein
MEVIVDRSAPPSLHAQVEAVVRRTVGIRSDAADMKVVVACLPRGHWSVFVTGGREHPLRMIDSIERALAELE